MQNPNISGGPSLPPYGSSLPYGYEPSMPHPSYPQQYTYPAAQQQTVPPEMFQQYHPFQYEYPAYAPAVSIIGYRTVPMMDPSGLMIFRQEPVYGYIYPHPITPDQPLSPPAAAAAVADSEAEPKDLELTDDEVGLALIPSVQEESEAIKEFFQSTQPQSFDHLAVLDDYLTKTSSEDATTILPFRYQGKFRAYEDNPNVYTWSDAMLHHPPIEMLASLKRIQSIFTTFQSSPENEALPSYLFPCSLSIPDDLKQRFSSRKMQSLLDNKDRMVLEVTLMPDGNPIHIFLRPMKDDEEYRKRNFGENSEKIVQTIQDSQYPTLAHRTSRKIKAPTIQQRAIETDTHIEFLSNYGVTIKAPKKTSSS